MINNYTKGTEAELNVITYLQLNGYHILAKRFKTKFGEIDIVAQKENTVIFCEVKRRRLEEDALECLSQKQISRISKSASEFMRDIENSNSLDFRIDFISLKGAQIIEHIENISF